MHALLTFDDGPGEDTPALLEVLDEHGVKGVFFVLGERVADHADVVARMARGGHAVGNHSWDHPDLRALSLHAIRDQLTRTSDAIEAVTGARPRVFRPPFGLKDTAIEALARGLGMQTVLWEVESYDWSDPGAGAIAEAIVSARAGAVVLLHDGPRGRGQTVEGVARALAVHG